MIRNTVNTLIEQLLLEATPVDLRTGSIHYNVLTQLSQVDTTDARVHQIEGNLNPW